MVPVLPVNSQNHFNPIALRKAKIVCNFGLSECNRVKKKAGQFLPQHDQCSQSLCCLLRESEIVMPKNQSLITVKILNIRTCMSEQTV